MSELNLIEQQIYLKEQEIENLKIKMKKKKSELQILIDKKTAQEEKERAAFNAKVVAEMEQRFGKFDDTSFENFLERIDSTNDILDRNL